MQGALMRGSMVRWPEAGTPELPGWELFTHHPFEDPNVPARREFSVHADKRDCLTWQRQCKGGGGAYALLTPLHLAVCLICPVCAPPWEPRFSIIRMSSVRTSTNPCSFRSSATAPQPPSLLPRQG